MTYLHYFHHVDSELRKLSYVEAVECALSNERVGHVCMVVGTRERLTLTMIAEIFQLVENLVGTQQHQRIELGDKTIVLSDLVYNKRTVEIYGPVYSFG